LNKSANLINNEKCNIFVQHPDRKTIKINCSDYNLSGIKNAVKLLYDVVKDDIKL